MELREGLAGCCILAAIIIFLVGSANRDRVLHLDNATQVATLRVTRIREINPGLVSWATGSSFFPRIPDHFEFRGQIELAATHYTVPSAVNLVLVKNILPAWVRWQAAGSMDIWAADHRRALLRRCQ